MDENKEIELEEFVAKYIEPAAKQLAKKLVDGDPLTSEELHMALACGVPLTIFPNLDVRNLTPKP